MPNLMSLVVFACLQPFCFDGMILNYNHYTESFKNEGTFCDMRTMVSDQQDITAMHAIYQKHILLINLNSKSISEIP